MLFLFVLLLASHALVLGGGIKKKSSCEYVNTLSGSYGQTYDFSSGNTLPLLTVPWGFSSWSPVTNKNNNGWWFSPREHQFWGMRLTRQPSPWMGDYASFRLYAALGASPSQDTSNEYTTFSRSHYSPWYFNTTLPNYSTVEQACHLEFTTSAHAAIMRVSFTIKPFPLLSFIFYLI